MHQFQAFISAVLLIFIHFNCFADNNNDTSSKQLTKQWVESLNAGSASELPLANSVSFYGSLLSAPINGKSNVVSFLNRITPSIQKLDVISVNTRDGGACIEMVFLFEQMPNKPVDEVHCLNFDDGKIESIRLYFDPRPFLEEPASKQE